MKWGIFAIFPPFHAISEMNFLFPKRKLPIFIIKRMLVI